MNGKSLKERITMPQDRSFMMTISKEFNQISQIKFKKIENINAAEALSAILLVEEEKKRTLVQSLKVLLSTLFLSQVRIRKKGNGSILFFFTPSYGNRKEHLNDYRNVVKCVDDSLSFEYKKKWRFNVFRLRHILLLIAWIKQLNFTSFSLAYKIFLAARLLSGYIYIEELKKYLKNIQTSIKMSVTFCDIHTIDYFITDFFNCKDVDTATLQHGIFEHTRYGWFYSFSHSKYFLGISEAAKSEAIASGIDSDRFIILGPMKYISGRPKEKDFSFSEKAIGVAFSGSALMDQNKILMEYAIRISKKYHLKIFLRLHPALNSNQISKLIKNDFINLDMNNTIEEFAYKCDFVIMGTTNAFGDLLVSNTIALRMVNELDDFSCIDDFKFSDYESLERIVDEIKINPDVIKDKLVKAKKLVCPEGNIGKRYKMFFKSVGEEQ